MNSMKPNEAIEYLLHQMNQMTNDKDLSKELHEKKLSIEKLNSENNSLKKQINALKDNKQQQNHIVEQQSNAIIQLKNENQELQEELIKSGNNGQQYQKSNATIHKLELKNKVLSESLDKHMKENERLYQELLDKNHEIMNLTDKIDVLINDKNSLTYEVENFSKSASSLQQIVNKKDDYIEQIFKKMQEQTRQHNQELQDLQQEKDNIMNQLLDLMVSSKDHNEKEQDSSNNIEFYRLEAKRHQEQAEKYHNELISSKTQLNNEIYRLKRQLDIKEDELQYINKQYKKLSSVHDKQIVNEFCQIIQGLITIGRIGRQ